MSRPDLNRILAGLRPPDLAGHPSSATLAAYHEGELTPSQDDALQEHLVACELCVARLLDLHEFLRRRQGGDR